MLGKVGNYAEEEGYSSILLQTELGNDSEKRPLSLYANHLRIPAHHFSYLKRLPIFSFIQAWNAESDKKFNSSLKMS